METTKKEHAYTLIKSMLSYKKENKTYDQWSNETGNTQDLQDIYLTIGSSQSNNKNKRLGLVTSGY